MRKFLKDWHFRNLSISTDNFNFKEWPNLEFPLSGTLKELLSEHHPLNIDLFLLPQQLLSEIDTKLWSYNENVSLLGAGRKTLLEKY